ncbi:MAG TPA: hypothetical protein DDY48_13095 [Erwinia persicina]|nr:hypothetical protein [Erwinia persicina]HBI08040.1 hypothetical protein [Erwinia persicina]HBT55408.1 hypothetical protein [Erwinia persicina]
MALNTWSDATYAVEITYIRFINSECELIIFCMQRDDEKTGVSRTFIAAKGNTGSEKQDDIVQKTA